MGLLGGTFDPVHKGHLQLAAVAAKHVQLDTVLFIPAAVPPHKPNMEVTPYRHRTALLELALAEADNMDVSTIEQSLPTPSYTIDTIRVLERQGKGEDYYYIMGLDAFLEIDTWKSYNRLLQKLNFIVVARSGYAQSSLVKFLSNLGYVKDEVGWSYLLTQKRLIFFEEEIMDISSSKVRDLLKRKENVRSYLPGTVIEYIQNQGLYQL